MREIKFRIYDTESKKILSHEHILKFGLFGMVFTEDERFNVMPYTGLKDQNGVEIYEGDIVNHDDGENSYIGIVKNDLFYFYVDGIEPNDSFDFFDVSDTSDGSTELTIIGNIYENPELLDGGSEE